MTRALHEWIADARHRLVAAGLTKEDAALDAEVLARHVLGWDRATLFTHDREEPPSGFGGPFKAVIDRRTAREPVALITGSREFWGLDFEVTRDVLVPRPETELLVEAAVAARDAAGCRTIADVGTGSGCLAVALALEFASATVVATDVSAAALNLARRNAARHDCSSRVGFVRSRFLEGLRGPFDLIVSNPPYIADGADLPPEVLRYEPPAALFAGPDGLSALRSLIAAAGSCLAPGGVFVVEFGLGQAGAVRALAESAGWRTIEIKEDLQSIPRAAVLTMKN